jgi:hypothetical protein
MRKRSDSRKKGGISWQGMKNNYVETITENIYNKKAYGSLT